MSTVTLSARVEEEEARKIDQLAAELGLDRGALLRQMIRRGL
ncbi:MAG: ribbon-helix-helix protein, CopG family, partial [Deltaproteobacteria bacterium]|nr:ribbon-helix-helix protein, CopG family [Deltaproteobacteria bacterium]